jgi:hypothetical protein
MSVKPDTQDVDLGGGSIRRPGASDAIAPSNFFVI